MCFHIYCHHHVHIFCPNDIIDIKFQYEGAVKEGGRGPSIWDTYTHEHPGTYICSSSSTRSCQFFVVRDRTEPENYRLAMSLIGTGNLIYDFMCLNNICSITSL